MKEFLDQIFDILHSSIVILIPEGCRFVRLKIRKKNI
jgi:hypothetical protein